MRLTVLGCSPSFPNPGEATSGYLLQTGTTSLLVDCGHGVVAWLRLLLEPWRLRAAVISHMHADHWFELIPLNFALQFLGPPGFRLEVWLPPGGLDTFRRVAEALGSDLESYHCLRLGEYDPEAGLYLDEVSVRFAPGKHFVPSWGMRFSAAGHGDIVYSADTARSGPMVDLLRSAPLALIEATELTYTSPSTAGGHSTAEVAAEMAREAGVDRLLLTHYPQSLGEVLLASAREVFGHRVDLARQGETYEA